jgi:hypothetical protein
MARPTGGRGPRKMTLMSSSGGHGPLLKRNDKRGTLAARRQQAGAVLTSDPGLQLISPGMPR